MPDSFFSVRVKPICTELQILDRERWFNALKYEKIVNWAAENIPCRLAEGKPFLQHAEDRLRHGLRSPGLEGSTFPEAQIVHQALVGVPALLPHGLQLVLVAVC